MPSIYCLICALSWSFENQCRLLEQEFSEVVSVESCLVIHGNNFVFQILLIFMKHMELLLQKTPADVTKTDVLPLIYGSLESTSTQVQELCLSIIPSFASLIDYSAMKNALFPRIRKLCITTQSLSVWSCAFFSKHTSLHFWLRCLFRIF